MVTKKYLAVGLIIVAVVAAFLFFFVDWEARAVKKHLQSLAKEMVWSPGESQITAVTRVKSVQDKIAEICQVNIPGYKISQTVSKNDVPTYLTMAKNYYKDFSVKFEDLKVESVQLPQAQAVTTAHVKATGIDGVRKDEVLVIEFNLQKVDQKWQITAAREVEVLEK
ncbi:MAG: hypothetical protein KBG22_08440 [Smithella sp.]|nr:hypothetical protein [Smithella sp.]HOU50741.1 hypothetical protein [Smithella sp.]HQG65786.1 hypothetical protein [Smithella sp.]HQH17602.1 hypothetical protein [Smithella sp.]HQI72562.1 hypothetical protein [Smithella sp.]